MKLNIVIGITLLVISNFVTKVEAQTINSQCGWVKNCSNAINKKETANSISTSTKVESANSSTQFLEGQTSTVAALTTIPQGNATILRNSTNSISQQITPPTDSNGNRIFRTNRSGPSYLGIGANFGVSGNGNLGGTSFAVISKLGLTDTVSLRPSVLILRDFASILIPVTYEFAPQQLFEDFSFSPYLGGGIAINTSLNSSVGPMITGGVDLPLSSRFTINVSANLAFLRSTDLGILVGLGYNF